MDSNLVSEMDIGSASALLQEHCTLFTRKQVLPKVIWEECVALAQRSNKVPIGYNWMPQIQPLNCRFPLDDNHPI